MGRHQRSDASALSAVGGTHASSRGILAAARANTIDAYVQDDIKIKSNFTLNIGVRWDYNGLPLATNTQYWTNLWPVLLNQVNTGSFYMPIPRVLWRGL